MRQSDLFLAPAGADESQIAMMESPGSSPTKPLAVEMESNSRYQRMSRYHKRARAIVTKGQAQHVPPGFEIDFELDRFPYCIVWTSIPPLTWFLPFVGHMGIADSNGIIFDFGGAVNVDNFMFARPMRYLQLHPMSASSAGGFFHNSTI